jgi:hypothetical protein
MSHLVNWPIPLIRQKPWYPGVFGVPGNDTRRGLQTSHEGVVFYVDPNAVGVSDQRDGTDPEAPLATVAKALTLVQPYRGDTIAVMANNAYVYHNPADGRLLPVSEEVVISVPGIRLVGVCPSSPSGIYWSPASDGGVCITIAAVDVLVEGFLFTEGAFTGCNGILGIWDGITQYGDNIVIRNCVFDVTVGAAIQLEFTYYAEIYNNKFWGCNYGLYLDPLGNGADFCNIWGNLFSDCVAGAMTVNGLVESFIHKNSIFNSNAQAGAAATNEGIDTTGGARNQVYDNWFSCLLPPAGAGDYADLNTASATDAWINNHCMNGEAVTNP